MTRKFDYFVAHPPNKSDFENWLTNLGQEGWELVAVTKFGYIFKREIINTTMTIRKISGYVEEPDADEVEADGKNAVPTENRDDAESE